VGEDAFLEKVGMIKKMDTVLSPYVCNEISSIVNITFIYETKK
jgi:hypothetical protein